jgi:hypothetical protein
LATLAHRPCGPTGAPEVLKVVAKRIALSIVTQPIREGGGTGETVPGEAQYGRGLAAAGGRSVAVEVVAVGEPVAVVILAIVANLRHGAAPIRAWVTSVGVTAVEVPVHRVGVSGIAIHRYATVDRF